MSIKVLQFICPTGYYGAERWITALVKSLNPADIETHLCITQEPESSNEIIDHCGQYCHAVHQLPMSSKFDFRVVHKLVQVLKTQKIDIIHTHGYKSDIIGVLAAKLAGVKSVCTPHGFENAEDWKLQAYLWLGGKAFHGFDKLCPLSPKIEEDLRQIYSVNPDNIVQIINGVDLSEIKAAGRLSEPSEASTGFRIGYIGQLISRKNLTSLLEAFDIFHARNPNSELAILGDGNDRETLERRCAEKGLTQAVKFLGFQPNRLDYLPTFDTFAMTSSLEGIPRCLMEAMAAGVPVTAYDIPGVDQLIQHEQTGLSVPFNAPDQLAEQWQRLADDTDLAATLAQAGQAYVLAHYSADRMAAEYTSLFRSLTDRMARQHA